MTQSLWRCGLSWDSSSYLACRKVAACISELFSKRSGIPLSRATVSAKRSSSLTVWGLTNLKCVWSASRETSWPKSSGSGTASLSTVAGFKFQMRTSLLMSSYLLFEEKLASGCICLVNQQSTGSRLRCCDNTTHYMLGGIPYIDKEDPPSHNNLPLALYYVKKLTRLYHHTNKNVTVDNWFISVPLGTNLILWSHPCGPHEVQQAWDPLWDALIRRACIRVKCLPIHKQ